jgi:hypothetical protein
MATVAKNNRLHTSTIAVDTAGPHLLGFRLFDLDALAVYVNKIPRTDFTITSTFSDGYDDNASITFSNANSANDELLILGALYPFRGDDLSDGTPNITENLDIELARIWSSLSELHRDRNRSLRFFSDVDPVELQVYEDGTWVAGVALSAAVLRAQNLSDVDDPDVSRENILAAAKETVSNALTPVLTGGSSNAYTLVAPDTITAYAAGQSFKGVINHQNTLTPTLNVDGLGNVSIKKRNSSGALVDLVSADFLVGETHQFIYTGTVFELGTPVSPNDADISSLDGRATTLETRDTDHESRIATLEATTGSGVDTYASTAAGITGTSSGQYFFVPSATTGQATICYLNSSGTAVQQYILASFDAIATSDFYSDVQYAVDSDGDLIGILMKDAAGAALLAKAEDGLRMIISQKTIDAIGYDAAVAQIDGELGRVLMRDGAANAVLIQRTDGLDFQPADELAYRMGLSGVAGALTQSKTTLGGRKAIKYTARIAGTPFLDDYVLFPATQTSASSLTVLSKNFDEVQVVFSMGQSNTAGPTGTPNWTNTKQDEVLMLDNVWKNSGASKLDYKGPKGDPIDATPVPDTLVPATIASTGRRTPMAWFMESVNYHRRALGLSTCASVGMNLANPGVSLEDIVGDADGGAGDTTLRSNVDRYLGFAKGAVDGYGLTSVAGPILHNHGPANKTQTKAAYKALLTSMWTDYKAKMTAKGITGSPVLVMSQSAGAVDTSSASDIWENRLAQHEFAVENSDVILYSPLYNHKLDEPDGGGSYTVHHSWGTLQNIAEEAAHALAMHEAGHDWTIGLPVISGSGTSRRIKLPMMGNERMAVIDDNRYAAGGITLNGLEVDSGRTILSVTVNDDYVDLTFDADPIGATLKYCFQAQDAAGYADTYSGFRGELCTTYRIKSSRGSTVHRRFIPAFEGTL